MADYVELFIDQGSDYSGSINMIDDITNGYVNAVGYTVTSSIKRSFYSLNTSGQFVCTVTDGANGEITMTMSAANTANMRAGRYVFDVKSVDTSGYVSRVLEGMITISPKVT